MKKLLPVLIILLFACHNASVDGRKKDPVLVGTKSVSRLGDSISLGDARNVTTTDMFVKDSAPINWTRVNKKPHNTSTLKMKPTGGIGWSDSLKWGGQLTVDTIKYMSDVMVYDSMRLVAYQKKDSTMVIIGDSATVIRVLLESMDWTRRLKVKYPVK